MTSRSRSICVGVALGLVAASLGLTSAGAASGGVWLAGDFHVHTTYSHDVCATPPTPENCHPDDPTDPYTWGFTPGQQIALAEIRGLDFVALTDHSTVEQQSDAGYHSDALTLVDAYENSLPGHAQMLGATRLYGGGNTCPQVGAIASALRADGGAFQINHPGDGGVSAGDWPRKLGGPECMVPDSVEVWNIGPWVWQPPAPSANDNDRAVRFWESFLDAGHHVAATGGSDNHWVSTHAVQGVGQPTTWVFAADDSPASVIAAVRAGRTTISNQPPLLGGVRLEMTAGPPGAPIGSIGDTVPRDSTFLVHATGTSGFPAALGGAMVRIVTNGGRTISEYPLVGAGVGGRGVGLGQAFVVPTNLDPPPTWVRAELYLPDAKDARAGVCPDPSQTQTTSCGNRMSMTAFTSAIYLS